MERVEPSFRGRGSRPRLTIPVPRCPPGTVLAVMRAGDAWWLVRPAPSGPFWAPAVGESPRGRLLRSPWMRPDVRLPVRAEPCGRLPQARLGQDRPGDRRTPRAGRS